MLKATVHYISGNSEEYNVRDISILNSTHEICLFREDGFMTYIPYITFLSISITSAY